MRYEYKGEVPRFRGWHTVETTKITFEIDLDRLVQFALDHVETNHTNLFSAYAGCIVLKKE